MATSEGLHESEGSLDAATIDRHRALASIGEELEAVSDGFFALPRGPGLGVALNEDAVAKYEVNER